MMGQLLRGRGYYWGQHNNLICYQPSLFVYIYKFILTKPQMKLDGPSFRKQYCYWESFPKAPSGLFIYGGDSIHKSAR